MDIEPTFLLWVPVLLFALSFHEFAHAWAAKQGGDLTAQHEGRLTLNPVSHIDPIGTVILPLLLWMSGNMLFGWARPVPFNERFLRKPIWVVWVALAGPVSNVIILLLTLLVIKTALVMGGADMREALIAAIREKPAGVAGALFYLGWLSIRLNLILAIFNVLPIPPLDGSKLLYHYVVRGTSNQNIWHTWVFLNQFGFIVLYLLLVLPGFRAVLSTMYNEPLVLIVRFLLN